MVLVNLSLYKVAIPLKCQQNAFVSLKLNGILLIRSISRWLCKREIGVAIKSKGHLLQ